jgi:hypothetical protein
MTEFSTTVRESLHQSIPGSTTSYSAIFAVLPVDFRGGSGILPKIQQDSEKINVERHPGVGDRPQAALLFP